MCTQWLILSFVSPSRCQAQFWGWWGRTVHHTGQGPSLVKQHPGIEEALFNFPYQPALLPYNDISSLPLFIFIKTAPKAGGGGGCCARSPAAAFLVLQLHLHTGRGNCAGAGRDAAAGTSASPARSPSPAPACPQIAAMTPYLFFFFNILKLLILFSKFAQVFWNPKARESRAVSQARVGTRTSCWTFLPP